MPTDSRTSDPHDTPTHDGPIERLIEYSARNGFMVAIFVGLALVLGIFAMRGVPLDAIPDLSDVQVIVFTEWKGREPQLVEDQITYPIVSAMLSAPKSRVVRGFSFFGLSFVYVLFEDGTDIYWARSRVLEYLNGIKTQLPPGVEPTLGPDATGVGWGFEYALVDKTGKHDLQELRSFQDWYLRYWLASVDGVSEVASVGGFEKQYQVDLDPNKLVAYNIPLKHVVMAIRKSNADVGGRTMELTGKEYFIRGRGYIKSVEDLENVMVSYDAKTGTPVFLKDIAHVHLGPEMRRGVADLDGKGEVVGGIVVVRFGENVLKVIERVKKKLEEVKSSLPEGVEVKVTYDRSDLIERAIETLKEKLIEESLVVSLVVVLFLLHFRSALVAIIVLPIAVVMAFIPMYEMKLTSNIMSLGGIAIAIGAMVDAAVVLIENAHKKCEHHAHALVPAGGGERVCERNSEHRFPARSERRSLPPLLRGLLARFESDECPHCRRELVIQAAKEVGKPLFFSLLIITVSFVPVFTLEQQEGRLFKPLAYTKTFSMFFAALLSVTLAPALMTLLIRGNLQHEANHPVSKRLMRWYYPWVSALMKRRLLSIGVALVGVLSCVPVYKHIGQEFMPPLNEGDMLYMPTTLPGVSITEAAKWLQIQDKIIAQFPEVKTVFGKVGRANTATDPAPLSMVETNIILHRDKSKWKQVPVRRWYSSWAPEAVKPLLRKVWPETRPRTWEELADALDQACKFPAWTNSWTMPIKTRIDMLTTGIRTPIGIKVFGADLSVIEKIGTELEGILNKVPGTRSVYAERVTGGYFVDVIPRRRAAARYGLNVEDVETVVQTAIGGMVIDNTIEGRERYTINVRYARELRDDLDKLRRVLVPTPGGAQVPLQELADIRISTGPPALKDEDGMLTGWVYVDITGIDIGTYVKRARAAVQTQLKMPPGYYLKWTGQYEFMLRVAKKLKLVVPVTVVIIVIMLFMNFRSFGETCIVMLSVPFAITGSLWILYLLKYNMSIAVWVGIIALAGLAAETGVVMIVYLDEAYHEFRTRGIMRNQYDLFAAITYGAVQRVRPKLMTVMCILMGLLPIMWGQGAGADVMKRIAAPMVGGVITSSILTLEIVPAIYSLYRQRFVKWMHPLPLEAGEVQKFYCPLHPEVEVEYHTQCPQCGFYLVEKHRFAEDEERGDASA